MESEFFSGEYSSKHELERLEKKFNDLRDELYGVHEHARGRPHNEIEKEMGEIEAQIKLHKGDSGQP